MISREAFPRYIKEKQQLTQAIRLLRQSKYCSHDNVKDIIKEFQKRIQRIDELMQDRIDWDNDPLCIITDKLLGKRL